MSTNAELKRQKQEELTRQVAFIYGRNKEDAKIDPDKRGFLPSRKFVDPDAIKSFEKEYAPLDPSFACPVYLFDELFSTDQTPIVYPSYEHALQATRSSDVNKRQEIRQAGTVREAKKIASKASSTDWKDHCLGYAKKILRDKFIRSKELKVVLMKTEKRTLAYTPEFGDLYWGLDTNGKGQNQYGKLLEAIRSEISKGDDLDNWIKDYVKVHDADSTDIYVTVEKDGAKVTEDCKSFSSKSVIFMGKDSDNDVIAAHGIIIALFFIHQKSTVVFDFLSLCSSSEH